MTTTTFVTGTPIAHEWLNDVNTVVYDADLLATAILKGNGTGSFAQAVPGTDYAPPTVGTPILMGSGTGGFSDVIVGTGLSFVPGTRTLSNTGTIGGVTSVTGTTPVVSSGGTTPAISMAAATGSVNGYLTSTDWTTFNNKQAAGSYLTNGGALGTPSSGNASNLTSFPTLNQNTTGSAAKWTTARLLAGNSVDGSANVPFANAFVTFQADSTLSSAQNIGLLSTGLLKNTVTAGVGTLSTAVAGTDYGTVTHTVGGLVANSVVVGNGTADVQTLDNVKVYSADTMHPSLTNIYGKVVYNYAASSWLPVCGTSPTGKNYSDKLTYFPAVGLSSRGTATDCWTTYVQDYGSLAFTDSSLYNSHYNTWAAITGIPAGLASSTSPSGSWNDVPTSGGTPTDPYYTEIGGYAVTLGIGTKGNYAEGIGVVVKDTPVFGGTPVEARLTAFTCAVEKNDAHNTWKSYGYIAYSNGAQQTTYAPLASFYSVGGWQYGLDLAGTYNQADINLNGGTITSNSTQIFINPNGTTVGSFSSTGLGVTGTLQASTSFGCNSKTPQAAYTVNAASTDLATVVALCNQLRAALVANGICV